MSKKKKIIMIILIIVAILSIISVGVYLILNKENSNLEIGKLNSYYNKLKNTDSYDFTATLDEENSLYYAKQTNKAYIKSKYKGMEYEYIIKDGDTNLIKRKEKNIYTFKNNETELYKIELEIRDIKDKKLIAGREKINDKKYIYEEYNGISSFYYGDITNIDREEVKTRFYFSENNLVYIKTIIDENNEQLLKIDYSENVKENLFEIPSDYKKM